MLADEFRPETLDEVIGNEQIKTILKSQFESGNIAHTILLQGQFGAGKTSIARLIAKQLDAELIEHNCGANGDIDAIRAIVNDSQLGSLFVDRKVIVLDEVHKVSVAAQNVLLKDTEEPNRNTFWILSTSEPDKIIAALKSRCMILEVEPVDADGIRAAVKRVTTAYNITVEDRNDWWKLVERSQKSLRVVYNLMEKLIAAAEKKSDGLYLSTHVFNLVIGDKEEEMTELSNLPVAFMQHKLLDALKALEESKADKSRTPFGTLVGLYNFLKKSPEKNRATLLTLSEILAKKELTSDWYAVEMVIWKHV